VLHLDRSRQLKAKAWALIGHFALAAAMASFLLVNTEDQGSLGFLSLRMATGLPFLAILAYTYLNWPAWSEVFPGESAHGKWRSAYLYAGQLAVAVLAYHEAAPAWILAFWAFQALASLAWGLRKDSHAWLRSSLILVGLCLCRGIGANLVGRSELIAPLNILAVPVAVVLILAGYILLRKRLQGEATVDMDDFMAGLNRLPWLAVQAVLLFGFIWVEDSGTRLTVWLSLYGLGMVTLGFLFQERLARLVGLGMLTACILKLFLYDLRGLSGLPRVLSFIVLGLVLVVVSFTYTRFKERLEGLL